MYPSLALEDSHTIVPEVEEFVDVSLTLVLKASGKDLVDFQLLGAALSTSNSEELFVAEALPPCLQFFLF